MVDVDVVAQITINHIVKKYSFTLYPAHSRIGRGDLVLRHSGPHFPLNSGDLTYLVEVAL